MATEYRPQVEALAARQPLGGRVRAGADVAEEIALVVQAKRELLLRVHAHRLRREDLEDCFAQAALELIAQARRGGTFSSRVRMATAFENRFLSRVLDRRRALSGRSPMEAALEASASLGGCGEDELEIADTRAGPHELVTLRAELHRLQRLAREQLTADQRLLLASQLALVGRAAFCSHYGWSQEKYRKVGQRARARLRRLMAAEGPDVPPAG